MLSRTITVAGVTYVRSRDAAREVNLALDYVSRLARAHLIDGTRVGGLSAQPRSRKLAHLPVFVMRSSPDLREPFIQNP
jgi:hypothetical protein